MRRHEERLSRPDLIGSEDRSAQKGSEDSRAETSCASIGDAVEDVDGDRVLRCGGLGGAVDRTAVYYDGGTHGYGYIMDDERATARETPKKNEAGIWAEMGWLCCLSVGEKFTSCDLVAPYY